VGDFGEGDIESKKGYPLCRITTATSPEVSRTMISPAPDTDTLPAQQIITEYWIILAATSAIPYFTQRTLYGLVRDAERILSHNIRLKDPATESDPLCMSLEISHQNRYESRKGRLLEAMVIRVRTVNIINVDEDYV